MFNKVKNMFGKSVAWLKRDKQVAATAQTEAEKIVTGPSLEKSKPMPKLSYAQPDKVGGAFGRYPNPIKCMKGRIRRANGPLFEAWVNARMKRIEG